MKTTRRTNQHAHSALVRGDDDGLHVRRFATSHEAAGAARARDLREPEMIPTTCRINEAATKRANWTPARLATFLGISKRTINRRCEAGLIPCIDHGTPTRPLRFIPPDIVMLIRLHGLRGVGVMSRTGTLPR